jgi:hypothetical protein
LIADDPPDASCRSIPFREKSFTGGSGGLPGEGRNRRFAESGCITPRLVPLNEVTAPEPENLLRRCSGAPRKISKINPAFGVPESRRAAQTEA